MSRGERKRKKKKENEGNREKKGRKIIVLRF